MTIVAAVAPSLCVSSQLLTAAITKRKVSSGPFFASYSSAHHLPGVASVICSSNPFQLASSSGALLVLVLFLFVSCKLLIVNLIRCCNEV